MDLQERIELCKTEITTNKLNAIEWLENADCLHETVIKELLDNGLSINRCIFLETIKQIVIQGPDKVNNGIIDASLRFALSQVKISLIRTNNSPISPQDIDNYLTILEAASDQSVSDSDDKIKQLEYLLEPIRSPQKQHPSKSNILSL